MWNEIRCRSCMGDWMLDTAWFAIFGINPELINENKLQPVKSAKFQTIIRKQVPAPHLWVFGLMSTTSYPTPYYSRKSYTIYERTAISLQSVWSRKTEISYYSFHVVDTTIWSEKQKPLENWRKKWTKVHEIDTQYQEHTLFKKWYSLFRLCIITACMAYTNL